MHNLTQKLFGTSNYFWRQFICPKECVQNQKFCLLTIFGICNVRRTEHRSSYCGGWKRGECCGSGMTVLRCRHSISRCPTRVAYVHPPIPRHFPRFLQVGKISKRLHAAIRAKLHARFLGVLYLWIECCLIILAHNRKLFCPISFCVKCNLISCLM